MIGMTLEELLWSMIAGSILLVSCIRLVQAALNATDNTDRKYDQ